MKSFKYLKKHKLLSSLLFVFLLLIGIGSFFVFKITLKEEVKRNVLIVTLRSLEVELYGKAPKVEDYIVSIENSEGDKKIDYDISEFKIKYLNDSKEEVDLKTDAIEKFFVNIYSEKNDIDAIVSLKIVDTIAPSLELKELTIKEGNSYHVDDFIQSCKDNSNKECLISFKEEIHYQNPGTYDIFIEAKDDSGNVVEGTTKLTIKGASKQTNNVTTSSKGYKIVTQNGITTINGVLIVNKTYTLPSNYGSGLTGEMMAAYNKMKQDASSEGVNLVIVSGFRSYFDQKVIYNRYVSQDGQSEADTYSARPGHSEHQSGLAFDLNWIDNEFKNTVEGIWLHNNAYKYGFILRYPEGKTNETGYIFEPWHYRYVGVDLATKLYNNGNWITIEDYFGITSNY